MNVAEVVMERILGGASLARAFNFKSAATRPRARARNALAAMVLPVVLVVGDDARA